MLAGCISVAIIYESWWWSVCWFTVACLTDIFDGRVARRHSGVSDLGGKLDHSADAFLVTTAVASLSMHALVPWLLAPMIALAFVQYYFDSRASQKQTLIPSSLGKWNGVGYYILVGFGIGQQATEIFLPAIAYFTYLAGWVLVVTTMVSMIHRLQMRRPWSSKVNTRPANDEHPTNNNG